MRTGVAGDLGRQAEQVEVLSPHLQEDLALRVELEGFLERLLDLVFVFLFVLMLVSTFLAGVVVEIVWGHGVQSSRESRGWIEPDVGRASRGWNDMANVSATARLVTSPRWILTPAAMPGSAAAAARQP